MSDGTVMAANIPAGSQSDQHGEMEFVEQNHVAWENIN